MIKRYKVWYKPTEQLYELQELNLAKQQISLIKQGIIINCSLSDVLLLPYSGVHDQFDTPIYEGDIVKKENNFAIVIYKNNAFWLVDIHDENNQTILFNRYGALLTVIGHFLEPR